MRLIDAEKLNREVKEHCKKLIDKGAKDVDVVDIAAEIGALLQDAQTVDAVPVVHGWWLTWEEQFPGRTPRKKSMLGVFCSACHNNADNMFNYCPNCGAKMDLEEEHG